LDQKSAFFFKKLKTQDISIKKLKKFVQKLKEFVQKLNVLELLGPVGFQFGVQKKSLDYVQVQTKMGNA